MACPIPSFQQFRMTARHQRLADERGREDDNLTPSLTTAAVMYALNDLTPFDSTPSDFIGAGGDFGGGGASGDF